MNEERAMIAETCDRLFAEHLDADVFRAAEAGDFPQGLWDVITENGLDRILVSEEKGGSGLGWEDAEVVLRAAGAHAAPVPLAEAIAAGWMFAGGGHDIPAGVPTIADAPPVAMTEAGITGELERVPWGRSATHVLVDAMRGDALHLAAVATSDTRVTADRNIGRDPRDALTCDKTSVTAWEVSIGTPPLRTLGALVRSCQMAGAISAALDLCVTYANERVQFGRPIGRFQAIQQQLAVMAGEAAAAGVAARKACRAVDRFGLDGAGLSAIAAAKIRTGEAAGKTASIAHQVHGAIGFTDEYRLHHLTRRLWAWRSEFGAEGAWSEMLGSMIITRGADNLWPDLTG
ncbi:MAG: acyl-CoA dehydrogenase family protein [Alphaproteobacteria bacterium]